MVRIRFSRLVISPQYGNCGPGDVVSCGESFARHCVEDLRAAEYLPAPVAGPVTVGAPAPAVAPIPEPVPEARAPKRRKRA